MADALLLEGGSDRLLLEGGSGVLQLEDPPTLPALVLTDAPVAYYRMGEASGSVLDSIGTNHGTATNSPTRDYANATLATDDGAIDFNGSSQYVSIPDNANQSIITTGSLSVECWVRPSGDVSQGNIVAKGAASNYEWAFDRNDTTSFRFKVWQLSGTDYSTADVNGSYPDNAWYHLVATVTAGALRIYVNGVDDTFGTPTYAGTFGNGTSAVNIARRPDNLFFFNGAVDEVAIYDYILNPVQIAAHYAARSVSDIEAHSGTAVLTGGGIVASTRVKGGQSASVLTGGGVVVAARSSARATTQMPTGAGVVTSSRVKGGSTTQVLTGGGIVVPAQTSARASAQALTASGRVVVSSTDDRQANVLLTGAGVVTSAITTVREASALLTGGGIVTSSASGFEGHTGTLVATGGGVVTTVQSTARASSEVLTGSGVVTLTSAANEPHAGTATLTGAGVVTTEINTARLLAALLSGGGVLTETQTTARATEAVLTASGRVVVSSGSNIQINVLLTGGGTVTTAALADRPAAFLLSGAGEASLSVTSARLVAVLLSGGGVVTASATGSEEPPFVPDIPHGGRNIKITRHVWDEDDEEVLIALLTM